MIANSQTVWNNFSERLNGHGENLANAVEHSIADGIKRAKTNTRERQTWKCQQNASFLVAGDAPKEFIVTRIQQSLICDFGEKPWQEIISHPLCKERDRALMLEVNTHEALGAEMVANAQRVFRGFRERLSQFSQC